MNKFTFSLDDGYGRLVTHTVNEEFLDDVVMSFQDFLRGCGYYFNGNLEFVEDIEPQSLARPDTAEDEAFEMVAKSKHYYDTNRNK